MRLAIHKLLHTQITKVKMYDNKHTGGSNNFPWYIFANSSSTDRASMSMMRNIGRRSSLHYDAKKVGQFTRLSIWLSFDSYILSLKSDYDAEMDI